MVSRPIQGQHILFMNCFQRESKFKTSSTPRVFCKCNKINLNNDRLWFFEKCYWKRKSTIYWTQTEAICHLSENVMTKALLVRHHTARVLPYGEVNTIVVIMPKKEGEWRDESMKNVEGKNPQEVAVVVVMMRCWQLIGDICNWSFHVMQDLWQLQLKFYLWCKRIRCINT